MGVFDVFSTSSSGLQSQSYALQNISGNIANATTTGYKAVNTSFADLLSDAGGGAPSAGGVQAYADPTNTIQGTVTATGVSTNMALSGAGYFAVAKNGGSAATPSFDAQTLYTRRGDFAQDQNGYLVNGAGYYLMGTSVDPGTGASSGSPTTPIRISGASVRGATLSSIAVQADGSLAGTYSDGTSAKLGAVSVAHPAANDKLTPVEGEAFAPTADARAPTFGLAGATITGGSVEGSNTDISGQFSKMIVTQQAYSANTKVLTTANDMLQTAINILR